MNIVLGATGQIGSMLANNLQKKGQPVRAVVRNGAKAQELEQQGIEVRIADYRNPQELKKAFEGGTAVFLLTPENPQAENSLAEVQTLIENYREALRLAGIRKIVGLSSMGAQNDLNTGNLYASYLLEHGFLDLDIQQVFVRPAYYYSNWMGYWELVSQQGVLPTFFPPHMALEMIAPPDVAEFLAEVMVRTEPHRAIYEISGPQVYRSDDIAKVCEALLHRPVRAQQILPEEWESTLMMAGFSKDAARNLIQMTRAVIDGKTKSELPGMIRCSTDFKSYVETLVNPSTP